MITKLKIITINFFILIFLTEILAFTLFKANFYTNPIKPTYTLKKDNLYLEFWNEKNLWGVWHKKNKIINVKNDCLEIEYRSNNYGNRDNVDYEYESKNNRALLIGDSFAEGYGVNIEDSFAKRLEFISKKQVLNFGTSGDFGPLQSYILYKNMASKFSHDELILFFLPANDFIDNSIKYSKILFENRYRPYYKNSSEGFVVVYPEESEPSENFPSSINRNKNSIKRLLNSFTYSSNIYREVKNKSFSKNNGYFYEDIESINGSIWSLKKLLEIVDENVKKSIIIIPTLHDLQNIKNNINDYKKLYWYKEITKLSKLHNTKIIDLADVQLHHKNKKSLFNKCDGHWNKKGSNYAANLYFNKINSSN